MRTTSCWLLLAAVAARAKGETQPLQQQPWVGTQQNYGQDPAAMGARDIRLHQQAAAEMPMPPPASVSGQAAPLAYQVVPGGAVSVPAQPHEEFADHSLMRSEAPVALDARGAQEVQSQSASYPTQYPAQYPQQYPQQTQQQQQSGPYGSAPVYGSQPAYGQQQQQQPAYAPGQQQQQQPAYGAVSGGMAAPSPYAAGYMAPSPTPVKAMIDGACIVPVWTKGKKDYLCSEGATTKLELKVEGEDEKLIKDGGSCTVVCPNWWMEATPQSMTCKKHEWSTAGNKVQCTVSKKVGGAFLFVVVVAVGFFIYNRQHQQAKAHHLQHGDPHAHHQAGAHAAPPPASSQDQQSAQ